MKENAEKQSKRKSLQGIVISDRADKTIVVQIDYQKQDSRFKKTIRKKKKIMAHDEENKSKNGNIVRVEESRPLSKRKSFRLVEIIK